MNGIIIPSSCFTHSSTIHKHMLKRTVYINIYVIPYDEIFAIWNLKNAFKICHLKFHNILIKCFDLIHYIYKYYDFYQLLHNKFDENLRRRQKKISFHIFSIFFIRYLLHFISFVYYGSTFFIFHYSYQLKSPFKRKKLKRKLIRKNSSITFLLFISKCDPQLMYACWFMHRLIT